jgi:formylglycine-generating enzyme required for sulfatase activity
MLAVLAGISLVSPAFATVNMAYVTVGNPGNLADPLTGYGAVNHSYKIGTFEVTIAQYAEFLNAKGASNSYGIFNSSMATYGITQTGSPGSFSYSVTSGFQNKPVVHVSWFDAARFTNWLGNGQGSGDMETGAYTLAGATSGIINVNPGATVYLPSEDEWYKAAHYNSSTATYSLYPTNSNTITMADANYNTVLGSTNVGSYPGDASAYSTLDQAGNVWEWNDTVLNGVSGPSKGLRGGGWYNTDFFLRSTTRDTSDFGPTFEDIAIGFRVASVPEPSSIILSMFASGMLMGRRRR